MHLLLRLILVCAALSMMPGSALPQTAPQPNSAAPSAPDPNDIWTIPDKERINAGTVTVITAPAGGATSVFGSDMARVLDDDQSGLRVLPVLGKGPVRNVIDVLYLKAIDMGAVAADVPEFYRLQYKIPDIASRLRYIAKLYNNELHVIARTSIKSIFDLEGKRIVAQTDVGYYSAKVIFTRLGINATFDYKTDDARSIQKIIDGQADAYITSTGKIFQLARNIKNENRQLHLVSIPYDRRLQDMYLPTTLSSEEYPNLLAPGETIDTVATSVLLVSFNWPENSERYARVAKFVDAFFSHIEEFYKPPRHPKWKESSISIVIPGWQRFKAAQDWLNRNGVRNAAANAAPAPSAEFQQFLNARSGLRALSPEETTKLYNDFIEWNRTKR
jgi:TRAP-type uncharacterized transport system substrate-binding protein